VALYVLLPIETAVNTTKPAETPKKFFWYSDLFLLMRSQFGTSVSMAALPEIKRADRNRPIPNQCLQCLSVVSSCLSPDSCLSAFICGEGVFLLLIRENGVHPRRVGFHSANSRTCRSEGSNLDCLSQPCIAASVRGPKNRLRRSQRNTIRHKRS
jgi:hypothetical protein